MEVVQICEHENDAANIFSIRYHYRLNSPVLKNTLFTEVSGYSIFMMDKSILTQQCVGRTQMEHRLSDGLQHYGQLGHHLSAQKQRFLKQ